MLMRRRDVATTAAIAVTIAVLAIIGAVWVVYETIKLVMPFLILIDGR